ncbi:Wzz/FepE/Etk N-terminal domain-containing protein [Nocardia sp. CDC153]|uniref:Wzz/FepE/Etk N-terminal domain-containing protein n=1 Tax=Nocardia sp. CDC153 TaxID=3112167 RepID=UPI002DB9D6E8|nr:Wzz/FepE/Etk N-terminal domain-containing protein [Nocardia sp. CDC153]MEC3955845.1 Wzz/FepE/Etk N-terminal domain-containing protein [Nocardia sp. CDC153]
MNSATTVHLRRLWRRKWLILAITVLAVALGFVSTRDLQPAYTSRLTLTIGSPNRAPDQDAVLSVGYAQYFMDPAYQSKLRSAKTVPADVTLTARTVASSPILYLEATASTPQVAKDAATKAGSAFRDEINASLRAAQDSAIAAVRKPFDDIRAANGVVSDASLTQMQDQINRINADTSNKLIDLQAASDPVRTVPSRLPTLLTYGVGGLLAGVVAAYAVALASRRLRSADEIEQRVGLTALAVVPGPSSKQPGLRDKAFRQVATAAGLAVPARKATIAVTAPESSTGIAAVARAIAEERARQGVRTILVHADLRRPSGSGVGEVVSGRVELDTVLRATRMPELRELQPGSTGEDPFTALSRERFARLLSDLHELADLVVVIAPPVNDAVETQVLVAEAATTVLVLDRSMKVGAARQARHLLDGAGATVLGAVLVEGDEPEEAAEPPPPADPPTERIRWNHADAQPLSPRQ